MDSFIKRFFSEFDNNIFGFILKPVTPFHMLAFNIYDNKFINGTSYDIYYVMQTIWIMSHYYKDKDCILNSNINVKNFESFCKLFEKNISKYNKDQIDIEVLRLAKHINESIQVPMYSVKDDNKQSNPTTNNITDVTNDSARSILINVLYVMQNYSLTEQECMDMPFSKLMCYVFQIARQNGLEIVSSFQERIINSIKNDTIKKDLK